METKNTQKLRKKINFVETDFTRRYVLSSTID